MMTGAVCVNVLRHPAWGRAQETHGEDPLHVGAGRSVHRGLQRHVMACAKYFACNLMENARFKVDIEVDEVALHEVYLPHFRQIVDAGVAPVVATTGSTASGAARAESLLTDVLQRRVGLRRLRHQRLGLRPPSRPFPLAAGLDVEMPARLVRAHHLADALRAR